MQTESQNKRILAYLMEGNRITPLQALERFGSLALAARIGNLRDAGHPIEKDMIPVGKKWVASYYYSKI